MELPIQLAMKLGPLLRSPKVEIGLAYRHLVTGAAWKHNDRRFPAGDLVRLPLAMATYQAVALGRFNLWDTLGKSSKRKGSGRSAHDPLAEDPSPDTPIRELLYRMVARTDWQAAESLLALVSEAGVADTLAEWGLTRTLVEGPLVPPSSCVTTPGEIASLLARLVTSDGLHPEHAAEILCYLRLAGPRNLPVPAARRGDLVALLSLGDDHGHLCLAKSGADRHLSVILTEGRAGLSGIAKMAATLDDYYASIALNEARVLAVLDAERKLKAPDPRLVAWDLGVNWNNGGLEVSGHTSAPEWSTTVDHLTAVADVPILDRVRQLSATPPFAIALAPVVHLRRSPAHAAELVNQVPMGAVLDVLEARADWWQVRAPDGTIAHARSTNLQPATERDAQRWQSRDQILIAPPLLTCRRLTLGTVVLSAGTRLTLVGRRKDGLLGRTPGREEVVVPIEAGRILPADLGQVAAVDREEILELATRFIGVPYLWGGASGWGVDCSGFAQLVLAMAGVRLPRDSDQQYELARKTSLVAKVSDLEPCDLVFFPGHVGLYLGRGEFLHASAQAGCVTVNTLLPGVTHYSSALARKFKGGGRFLPSQRG